MSYCIKVSVLMKDGNKNVWVEKVNARNIPESTLNIITEKSMTENNGLGNLYQINISKENEDEIVDNYSVL